jgi:UDP-N-acetylglucosamine 2-epimerase (non-hydrolysing)
MSAGQMSEQLRVMLVFGTRPEAIKMAPLAVALRDQPWCQPLVCVTGQHREMLDQVLTFFGVTADDDLGLLEPGQTLSQLTARAIAAIEPVMHARQPHAVVVQGDTTSTFVGALSAFYHQIPVVHLEAGLRTDNPFSPFPEEINRRMTGQLASLHLAATAQARDNLMRDGVATEAITVTGNTVIDALRIAVERNEPYGDEQLEQLDRTGRPVVLITAHRRESWGEGMASIGRAISRLATLHPGVEFVFPIHRNPLVRDAIVPLVSGSPNVTIIEPLAYGSFSRLMNRASIVLTDSGGVQEEAPSLGKPVLVMRDTTERPEAVRAGTAKLIGTDESLIVSEVSTLLTNTRAYDAMSKAHNPYGDGQAVSRSVAAIGAMLGIGKRLPEFLE